MIADSTAKQALKNIWEAAINAVAGRRAVLNAIDADGSFIPDLIIAVGKAAAGMCAGARERFPHCRALVVTKYDHVDDEMRTVDNIELIESGHPIPDQNSLLAGNTLLERVNAMPGDSRLLMLVSGGASALAEALPEGMSLESLQAIADEMIASGKTIGEINARRKQTSLIKDGKLIEAFNGTELRVYAISDVEGDGIAIIGSGLGDCHRARVPSRARVIGSNTIARDEAERRAVELGYEVKMNEETLYGDVFELAAELGPALQSSAPGVYIFGGEPTVVLPECPGHGGRNQSLALALAEYVEGRDNITILVAGTDGTDGPTDAAGGLVDGDTWHANARDALERADAGTYLKQSGSLFVTGPTSTNVMDLVIAIIE